MWCSCRRKPTPQLLPRCWQRTNTSSSSNRISILAPAGTTNDPSLASQWHLTKIGVQAAWDTSTGSEVIIAILDTGVDGSHPDLAAQMIPGWNVYDNNSDTSDVHGHGTAVAGTAAAAGNNADRRRFGSLSFETHAGACADPSAYAYFSSMASGLIWAADHGARVANISFENVGQAVPPSTVPRSTSRQGRADCGLCRQQRRSADRRLHRQSGRRLGNRQQ
jgi:thermitase